MSYIHLLLLKQIHTLFRHTHSRCGLWLSQLSGGVLWSIGVGGFCFLLLCQVPSQRLLISVNLSCATTFSFPLPLSLSPISLTFPFSLSPHLHLSVFSLFDLHSHCIYCRIPFPKAAADHPIVTPVASAIVPSASHSHSGEAHLSYRRRRQAGRQALTR